MVLFCRIRELSTARIGTLLRISGQVVRTHPVHPELVSGTFLCLDCQSVIKDVEQQFKYTQPTICKNPVCANRRRFMLDTNKSRFVDFQKVNTCDVRCWGILGIILGSGGDDDDDDDFRMVFQASTRILLLKKHHVCFRCVFRRLRPSCPEVLSHAVWR